MRDTDTKRKEKQEAFVAQKDFASRPESEAEWQMQDVWHVCLRSDQGWARNWKALGKHFSGQNHDMFVTRPQEAPKTHSPQDCAVLQPRQLGIPLHAACNPALALTVKARSLHILWASSTELDKG